MPPRAPRPPEAFIIGLAQTHSRIEILQNPLILVFFELKNLYKFQPPEALRPPDKMNCVARKGT
jgi:hypothetical protein